MKKITLRNQKGYSHNIALLTIGVLVLGVIGFAGFRVYKEKNSANASALTPNLVLSSSGSRITACQLPNGVTKFGLDNTGSSVTRLFNYRVGAYRQFLNEYKAEWISARTNVYRYVSASAYGTSPYGAVRLTSYSSSWVYGSITTPYYFRPC